MWSDSAKRRVVAATVIVALFAVGCSRGGFEPAALDEDAEVEPELVDERGSAAEVPIDGGFDPELESLEKSTLAISSASLVDGPLDTTQAALVVEWFDSFLNTRDLFYVGRATAEDLAVYSSDRAFLSETAELQAAYVDLLEQDTLIATEEFASFSNPSNMMATRGRITFDDCTEQQSLSVIGVVGFIWVTQRVTLAEIDGDWEVAQLEVVHDGQPWSAPYGCAPESLQERALAVAQQVMEENRGYQQDPDSLPQSGGFAIIDDETTRQSFLAAVQRQQDEGLAVTSPEEFRYTVQGLNVPASLEFWAVVVDVCSHRPEGLGYRQIGSDDVVQDNSIEPGFSLNFRVTTALETAQDGLVPSDRVVTVEPLDTGCW